MLQAWMTGWHGSHRRWWLERAAVLKQLLNYHGKAYDRGVIEQE
jgi:hypothetical protein